MRGWAGAEGALLKPAFPGHEGQYMTLGEPPFLIEINILPRVEWELWYDSFWIIFNHTFSDNFYAILYTMYDWICHNKINARYWGLTHRKYHTNGGLVRNKWE